MYDGGSAPRWTKNLSQSVKGEDDESDERQRNKGSSESVEAEDSTFRPMTESGMAPTPTTPGFGLEPNDTLSW